MRARVATYNAHDCVGRDGKYSPERIAQVILELRVDIVALQEVTLDHTGDLIGYLEKATGMRAVDGTVFDRGVGRYGNVLLSRQRIRDQQLRDLSFPNREPRGVIDAVLEVDGGSLRVLATHLGLAGPERKDQLRKVADLLADDRRPTMLLGDFNVWLSERPFRDLRDLGFTHRGVRSFPTWFAPLLPLDRIFVRAPAVLQHCSRHDSRMSRIASDHFPVVADVDIRGVSGALSRAGNRLLSRPGGVSDAIGMMFPVCAVLANRGPLVASRQRVQLALRNPAYR